MIEGLQIDLSGEELQKIYRNKAQWCWDQLVRCQTIKSDCQAKGTLPADNGEVDRDPVTDTIHNVIRDMREGWKEYLFLADHVNIEEKYVFKRSDLKELVSGLNRQNY